MTESRGRKIMISCNKLSRSFDGGETVIRNLDLQIHQGDFVTLLGPSGCGKSTLLRIMSGLDGATSGEISVAGSRAPGSVAFVFQEPYLLPWCSVVDNVSLPLRLMKQERKERHRLAHEALRAVGLVDAHNKLPHQLSGGMRMRASVARALVTQPRLLLMDEPFAALDELTRQSLQELMRNLWQREGVTIVFVTHSVAEAVFVSERAVVFSSRECRVVLDRVNPLPRVREFELRNNTSFVDECRALSLALRGTPMDGREGLV